MKRRGFFGAIGGWLAGLVGFASLQREVIDGKVNATIPTILINGVFSPDGILTWPTTRELNKTTTAHIACLGAQCAAFAWRLHVDDAAFRFGIWAENVDRCLNLANYFSRSVSVDRADMELAQVCHLEVLPR